MQGLQLTAVYKGAINKSPWDLLKDTGKFKLSDGQDSLMQLMHDAGASTLRLAEHVTLAPAAWRKPGFARPGTEGFRGPYDGPAPPTDRWWGDAHRSTPHQDKARRQGQ